MPIDSIPSLMQAAAHAPAMRPAPPPPADPRPAAEARPAAQPESARSAIKPAGTPHKMVPLPNEPQRDVPRGTYLDITV